MAAEVRFLSDAVRFSEGVGIIYVPVERTSTTANEQISIQTTDGSAVAGVDYLAVDQDYTFPAGVTQFSIAVRVLDNPVFQPDREFTLSLVNPVGLDLGSPSTATLTIADNDTEDSAGRGAAGVSPAQGTFAVATDAGGKILLGGLFSTFNGEPHANLVRISPDGGIDSEFDPGSGPNSGVVDLRLQPDGKIVIGGNFSMVSGVPRAGVARLDSNGTLDQSFDPGSGMNGGVESVTLLVNGRVLVAGPFVSVDGIDRQGAAVLTSGGQVDDTFVPVLPPTFYGHVAKRQDGKFLVGGGINPESPVASVTNLLVRLEEDGSRDNAFEVRIGTIFDSVWTVALQTDGKILIGGTFLSVDGNPSAGVARLDSNGNFDDSFDVGAGADDWVLRIALQDDGKILLGGFFTAFGGVSLPGIARLNSDGSPDPSFNPGLGTDDVTYVPLPLLDGTILLTGGFRQYNGYDRFRFARLNPDGSLMVDTPVFASVGEEMGAELSMNVRVEPGRPFRLYRTDDFGVRTSVLTNNTARTVTDIRYPMDGDALFFYLEQGF